MTRSLRQIASPIMLAALFLLRPGTDVLASGWDVSVDVWLDKGDGGVYQAGESVTVYFKADADCFVTVYNIDTDGNIRILFPVSAEEGNYVAGGQTYYVPAGIDDHYYIIDEPAGMGYIEAVASPKPFFLEGWPFFVSREGGGHHPDEVVDRIAGDPFLAMEEINTKILPFGEDTQYTDDFAVYYVEEVVSYPRYVCNDCHQPVYYHYEPYHYPCHYVDIVIYDYWWYNRWFYCDYWWADYYWYYDYYYYSPPPPYLGRRYTRKYGYTRKYPGGYGYSTKGYGDKGGVVRVADYYRQKDDYRDDFSTLDPKNNAVVSYKLPETVNEAGYVPGGGVTKKGPAADGSRVGDQSVTSKSPAGSAGTDFKSGSQNVRTKSPVHDGTVRDGSQDAESGIRGSRSKRAFDGGERSGSVPQATRKAPAVEREAPKTVEPPRSGVQRPSPVRDDYKRPSEEYKLQGWDRSRSSDAKKSSSLSIIKSKPRSSGRDRSTSKPRVAPSRSSTSTRSTPQRSISPRSSGTRSTPKINRSAPSSRSRSTPKINRSSRPSHGRSTPTKSRSTRTSRGRSSSGGRRK